MLKLAPVGETLEQVQEAARADAPYLARLVRRDAHQLSLETLGDLDVAFGGQMAALRALVEAPLEPEATGTALRRAKRRAHLVIALADLAGHWPLEQVTSALTELADASVEAALASALAARDLTGEGLFLIALGKMGAGELNYSSDIDIAAFYDPERFSGGARGPADTAARLVRDVCRLMEAQTEEGYVFRTDLRLRPDPRSTPVAVSTRRAEVYYESVGQNWERMVWIKARPCAGDRDAAAAFQEVMAPFVWRRHLDYWAIADIYAIKRMINAQAGDPALDSTAPDVKLGPGGIREIEFFVQTQQLILGGRNPALRLRGTLETLNALVAAGAVEAKTAAELAEAYGTLRAVEHRVQMLNDEQTHTLPDEQSARQAVARLCGIDDLSVFDAGLRAVRQSVHAIYLDLFAEEDRQSEAARAGNLVFTGVDNDPGTIETLRRIGFEGAEHVIETVRDWHFGRVPATSTRRGQELLTTLTPALLLAMGRTGEPDLAFRHFERFFAGLRSGVQLLSMLQAEPELLEDLVSTLAIAPRLAQILASRPALLEALISGTGSETLALPADLPFDAAMDAARRHHRDRTFLIGHRLLHGRLPANEAAAAWSALADETIRAMAHAAESETARRYGKPPGRWSVIAMGRLGAEEMTAGSDLDLLVIYDPVADAGGAQSWFTRFTQRLITALSAPTAEGMLYEVDMRLRPSGRAGPVAVRLSAFERYQTHEAWTWEHMALTRMRPVAGDSALGAAAHGIACEAIEARRKSPTLAYDIADMRARLRAERPGGGLWDLKLAPGGIVDIEFIAQYGLLTAGCPSAVTPATALALAGLEEAGWLSAQQSATLQAALSWLSCLQQILRLAVGDSGAVDPAMFSAGLKDRLCRAVDMPDFVALETRLREHKSAVFALHEQFLQPPATEV